MDILKLSELDLKKFIYMSVGTHAGEPLNKIIKRKENELRLQKEDGGLGYCLWAYSSPVMNRILDFFDENEEIYVLMFDTGEDTTQDKYIAEAFADKDGHIVKIPYNMEVKCAGQKGQALCISELYKVDSADFCYRDYTIITDSRGKRIMFNGCQLMEKTRKVRKNRNDKEPCYIAKLTLPLNVELLNFRPIEK